MTSRTHLFIGGTWQAPHGSGSISVVNPATETVVGTAPHPDAVDVDRAVSAARAAFDTGEWRDASPADRADLLDRIATGIEARTEALAQVITAEIGSPITVARQRQVPPAVGIARQYAGLARALPVDVRSAPMGNTVVAHEPVGVVGAIVPWNVPLTMAIVKLAPALAAGCTVVLKPAVQSPLDAYLLAEALEAAGAPPGVVNIVAGDGSVGAALAAHPGVDKVAFTGSTAAGRAVLHAAADRIARVSLELGGKSAAVVLDDADLASTVDALLPLSVAYSGQACHAQTRWLVPRHRHDDVVTRLVEAMSALRVGDPDDEATQLGPLVSRVQRDRVEGYVDGGLVEGATLALDGRRPRDRPTGWFVGPTVFAHVDNRMRIAQEEIFGPVVCVIPYDDDEDAIRIANDSQYGLSGSVWSADEARAYGVAAGMRTGAVTINGQAQSPAAPFGGFKQSGLGREAGPEGLAAYQELKAISVSEAFAGSQTSAASV